MNIERCWFVSRFFTGIRIEYFNQCVIIIYRIKSREKCSSVAKYITPFPNIYFLANLAKNGNGKTSSMKEFLNSAKYFTSYSIDQESYSVSFYWHGSPATIIGKFRSGSDDPRLTANRSKRVVRATILPFAKAHTMPTRLRSCKMLIANSYS